MAMVESIKGYFSDKKKIFVFIFPNRKQHFKAETPGSISSHPTYHMQAQLLLPTADWSLGGAGVVSQP